MTDASNASTDWPGVGETPEPEPEGFREEQIEAEKQRRADEVDETQGRSDEAKDWYSGGAARDEGGEQGAPQAPQEAPAGAVDPYA